MKNTRLISIIAICLLMLFYALLSYFLLLKDPAIWPDEPYFVNIAHNLKTTGVAFLDLYGQEAIGSPHIRALSYPPLFTTLLSYWISWSGMSIERLRLLSVLVGGAAVLVLYRMLLKLSSRTWAFLGTLLLILYGPFSMVTRVVRMDVFIVLSILLAFRVVIFNQTNRSYFLSGIFVALGILLHPIGIICAISPVVTILTSKNSFRIIFKKFLFFCLPILIGLGVWFISIYNHAELFTLQMQLQFGYKLARTALVSLLFQNDLVWRLILLIHLSVIFLGTISGFIQKKSLLVVTSISALFTLIVVILGVDQWYLAYISLFPVITLVSLINGAQKPARYFYLTLLLLLISLNGYQTFSGIAQQLNLNKAYYPFAQAIERNIPTGSRVALSAIPDPYFILVKRPDLKLYQIPHVSSPENLERLLKSVDVIVFNFATNEYLLPIMGKYRNHSVKITQEDGYEADLIFLKH